MLREDLDRIDAVPMLPEMVGKILTMMDDPNISAVQLANVVSKDQSLVSSILRIVNSAYYGLLWRITSVSQAVVLLGFRTIRNLVLAATVMNSFGGRARAGSFNRGEHWRHSIACAAATAVLAKKWKSAPADEAFLTGLVHDIGRVIMDQYFPEEFEEALVLADLEGKALLETEMQIFGLTHAEIGRHVARKWSFPDGIVNGIGDHHGPATEGEWEALAALVHVADVMVRRAGLALGQWQADLSEDALRVLGHSEEDAEALSEAFMEEYQRSNVFEDLIS
ncbi:MAG: HDOD domain-containing protein [Candidatus Eisenbacteria sp.]|nr:HDOD domain-containing protein [Candidatus Eisenbacteria bacterium]